jgi:hypothetical protein
MNTPNYKVHFLGGPSDGAVVSATTFPFGNKLWMPASAAVAEAASDARPLPPGHYRSVYCLHATHHLLESGQPTILHEFHFAGLEILQHAPWETSSAVLGSHWLSRAVNRLWHRGSRNLWIPLGTGRAESA